MTIYDFKFDQTVAYGPYVTDLVNFAAKFCTIASVNVTQTCNLRYITNQNCWKITIMTPIFFNTLKSRGTSVFRNFRLKKMIFT